MVGVYEGIWLRNKLDELVFLSIKFFLRKGLFDLADLLVAPDCLT
jgi:hypothetical protein